MDDILVSLLLTNISYFSYGVLENILQNSYRRRKTGDFSRITISGYK